MSGIQMTREQIRALNLLDLIDKECLEHNRSQYRDEILRRMRDDPGFRPYLGSYVSHANGPVREEGNGAETEHGPFPDEPPTAVPLTEAANQILRSGWDCSGLKKDPQSCRNFLEQIRDKGLSELLMSGPQVRLWRSIRRGFQKRPIPQ